MNFIFVIFTQVIAENSCKEICQFKRVNLEFKINIATDIETYGIRVNCFSARILSILTIFESKVINGR